MAGDRSQRTEKPTGRRLLRARKEGNVPRTRELPGALVLAGFLVFCHYYGGAWLARLRALFTETLSGLAHTEISSTELVAIAGGHAATLSSLLIAPLGIMLLAGLAGNFVQGPPPFTLKPLRPDFSKLNPITGLRKVVRAQAWVEMGKSLLKTTLYTAIAVAAVHDALADGLPVTPGAEGTLAALALVAGKVTFRVVVLALIVSILDWLYNRFAYTRQLMMTKQEVRDERKEQEGDPLVRARIRSRQMTMARSRMMADVPKATVVVTNPTHYAVALRYVPEDTDVPRVLAKGRGLIAERIREIARQHEIPVISDPPLARALFRAVEVGGYIPEKLFRAVAEVLALVLRRDSEAR
jgi:flagellar biosynthetic protein FlhB